MQRFTGTLASAHGGGHSVTIPADAAAAAGLRRGVRVRGTVDGVDYRSSLMEADGSFHLGVHKATVAAAKAAVGAVIEVTIEIDDQPLPTDTVPADLADAIAGSAKARDRWAALAPSHRREHVQHVLSAKQPDTRARRIAKTIATLAAEAKPAAKAKPPAAKAKPAAKKQRR